MTSIGKGSCRATGREPARTLPSVPGRVNAKAKASGFSSRSSRFAPPSALSHVRVVVHCSLELAKVRGDGIRGIRARGNWLHVKQPAICNPRGLILRGNDDLGTIRLPAAHRPLDGTIVFAVCRF